MEPRKPKIPAEAVQLYTRYIHGEISRRDFLSAANRFTTAGLTAAAIVGRLMPNYALGQQVGRDDERIRATYETVPSPNGNGFIRGYLVRPFSADSRSETPSRLPGVIVIHENRGLNPHTEDVANIRAAMLIHHGALDTRQVEAYPAYKAALESNNTTYEGHIYPDAVYGFFNDATPKRYNKAAAEQAWTRTIEWFNQYVREGSA